MRTRRPAVLSIALIIGLTVGLFLAPARAVEPAAPPDPPLIVAAKAADLAAVNALLAGGTDVQTPDRNKCTALNWAAYNGALDVARTLIAHHARIDPHENPDGWTPLMNASAMGFADVAALLIEHGADINTRSTAGGYTPLMYAARKGKKYVAELLLDHGARVNDRSDDKRTALDFVDQEKDAAISRLLIARGGVYGLAH